VTLLFNNLDIKFLMS